MKKLLTNLIALRTNLVGTVLVSLLASSATLIGSHLLTLGPASHADQYAGPVSNVPSGSSLLDCDEGIYSPVQRECVSQEVFDGEMERLFAALGIDTTLYRTVSNRSPDAADH